MVAVYVAGLATAFGIADDNAAGIALAVAFALVGAFLLGLAIGRMEALAGPVIAVIAYVVTWVPTPGDYTWMDTGPVVLVIFIMFSGLILVILGMCVSAGVRVARATHQGGRGSS